MVGYIPVNPGLRVLRLPSFVERVQQSHDHSGPGDLSPRVILQYDGRVGDLRPFLWPTENGERVTPDKLDAHRLTHYFLGPSCLCAFLDATNHKEAAIGLAQMVMDPNSKHAGEYLGQYVAMCAEQRCGYFVELEHFYSHYSLPLKEYPRRKEPLQVKDPFLFMTDDTEETARYSGLRQVVILHEEDNNALRGSRKLLQRQDPHAFREVQDNLERLLTDGVSAEIFWNLFVQCTQCKVVMPRHHYPYTHPCAIKALQGTMARYRSTFIQFQRDLRAEDAASRPQDGGPVEGDVEGGGEDESESEEEDAVSEISISDSLSSLPSDPYVAMFGPRAA